MTKDIKPREVWINISEDYISPINWESKEEAQKTPNLGDDVFPVLFREVQIENNTD